MLLLAALSFSLVFYFSLLQRCPLHKPKFTSINLSYVLSLSLSLSLLFLPLLIMIKYRLFGMTDSGNTSEEAVQNPQHHHGEWAISGSNLGSQQWRHFDCQSHKQSSLQRHHSLVIACTIQLLNMISIYTYLSFTKL